MQVLLRSEAKQLVKLGLPIQLLGYACESWRDRLKFVHEFIAGNRAGDR